METVSTRLPLPVLPEELILEILLRLLDLFLPFKPLFENSLTRVEPGSFTVTTSRNILGSCYGLLCMYISSQRSFSLYNLSIRFISKNSPKSSSLDCVHCYYGFGYDQVNDKYKMLLVVHNTNDYLTKIYTFGEDSWKTIPNFPCTPTMRLGKFVGGTLNWMDDKRGVTVAASK
ncbi:F-box protein interaction domain protein [Medicago truncatula]|uniref:F-box protein interaction domain protein n=1 Tax=Medicago truncatula TaxID=3880 RepID=A0A072U4L0_MEDTR|nr:F-box protein interaction domain protein [Medicago truncatula]